MTVVAMTGHKSLLFPRPDQIKWNPNRTTRNTRLDCWGYLPAPSFCSCPKGRTDGRHCFYKPHHHPWDEPAHNPPAQLILGGADQRARPATGQHFTHRTENREQCGGEEEKVDAFYVGCLFQSTMSTKVKSRKQGAPPPKKKRNNIIKE